MELYNYNMEAYSMEFPINVALELKRELLLEDMDDYDPDSYDEESIDWLDIERGNSLEVVTINSWEELKNLLDNKYKDYEISAVNSEFKEAYLDWCERNVDSILEG